MKATPEQLRLQIILFIGGEDEDGFRFDHLAQKLGYSELDNRLRATVLQMERRGLLLTKEVSGKQANLMNPQYVLTAKGQRVYAAATTLAKLLCW